MTSDLYLEVLPITGTVETPQLGGEGPVIEYALKMHQFPQSQLLSTLQANGEMTCEHIDEMVKQIAHFHLTAPKVAQEHTAGTPDKVMGPVRQNFDQILPFLSDKIDLIQLEALQSWAENSFKRFKTLLAQRKLDGFTRECHGDIHLGNATMINDHVVIFDCIEFNEQLRLIDVYADISFLAMDLEDRGLKHLSSRFINQYLELTGDYQGLEVLNFYKAYRALVRAKVALFRMPIEASPVQIADAMSQYRNYSNLAESYSTITSKFLAITHGVSAVGKSSVAMHMVEELGAVRLRSDVERKRLLGEQQGENTLQAGIYSADASNATYAHLNKIANSVLRSGSPVVLDATFLKHEHRYAASKIAEANGELFLILDCRATPAVIDRWIAKRKSDKNDPSDATLTIIEEQQNNREPLRAEELLLSKLVETNEIGAMDDLVAHIRKLLPGR